MYPGGENERYLEVWNLVFSEFNHNKDHTYTPLPNKNIDTGMGLERMASVAQNVRTNYETDLFMPIIEEVEKFPARNILKYRNKMWRLKSLLITLEQSHLQFQMVLCRQMKDVAMFYVVCYVELYVLAKH